NSAPYLILLGVAVTVFWLLPARFRRAFVLLASVTFYASWGPLFVWLPLLVAGVVFFSGGGVMGDSTWRKLCTRLGVACALALLTFFKYREFLLGNLQVLGLPVDAHAFSFATSLAFPVGISFYTFEAIAYLVDLRQGRVKMPDFV